eukprot:m.70061 g.70061  ORF g.70061 m.70061 type:complete len:154 (+) comp16814_c0_seq1:199-660(+)
MKSEMNNTCKKKSPPCCVCACVLGSAAPPSRGCACDTSQVSQLLAQLLLLQLRKEEQPPEPELVVVQVMLSSNPDVALPIACVSDNQTLLQVVRYLPELSGVADSQLAFFQDKSLRLRYPPTQTVHNILRFLRKVNPKAPDVCSFFVGVDAVQ